MPLKSRLIKVGDVAYYKKMELFEESREYKTFKDVDVFVKEIMDPLFYDILNIERSNVEDVFRKIQESEISCEFISRFIGYTSKIRPKSGEMLSELFKKVSKLGKKPPDAHIFKDFSVDKLSQAIKEDNVDDFIKISSEPDFNPFKENLLLPCHLPFFVNRNKNDPKNHIRGVKVTYMQTMAFYGAIKCFKYALLDGSFDDRNLTKYAVAGGDNEIIHLIEQKGERFDDCFLTSVKYNRYNISDWLLNNFRCSTIPLSMTVECFNFPAFLFVLKNGEYRSLIEAFSAAVENGNMPIIKYLVEKCEIHVSSFGTETPLQIACKNNKMDIVKYLFENTNVNPRMKYNRGPTALEYACENNNMEMVKFLIEKVKVDLEERDNYGITALLFSCIKNNFCLFKYLYEECHANANVKDNNGNTALHIACENNNIEMVKYLIEKVNVDLEERNNNGETALLYSCRKNSIRLFKYLYEKCHADINTSDNNDNTALHIACKCNCLTITKYIVERGSINTSLFNKDGKTACDIALDQKNFIIADILKSLSSE